MVAFSRPEVVGTFFSILLFRGGATVVVKKQMSRLLQDVQATSSFDLLCERLGNMPDFSCECVNAIPFRSIECQSSEICSKCNVCGSFLFQVDFLGPDIAQLKSCVSYTNEAKHDFQDGCFALHFQGESSPSGCGLAFERDSVIGLEDCGICSICDVSTGNDVFVRTDCERLDPMASEECTPVKLDAFFPGFQEAECIASSGKAANRLQQPYAGLIVLFLALSII